MDNKFEVQNEQLQGLLTALSVEIERVCKPIGMGFALFIFPYLAIGKDKGMFYASNADRQDFIKALKEFIAKQERP